MSTLGKEFANFKDVWDTIPSDQQTLNLLMEKLCNIELRDSQKGESKQSAFVSQCKRKQNYHHDKRAGKTTKGAKQKFPCNKCKQLDHWAAECPESKDKPPDKDKDKIKIAFITYALEASVEVKKFENWYCDSGASVHITPNKQNFASYIEFSVPETISLGKRDTVMKAYGQGLVNVKVYYNNS